MIDIYFTPSLNPSRQGREVKLHILGYNTVTKSQKSVKICANLCPNKFNQEYFSETDHSRYGGTH